MSIEKSARVKNGFGMTVCNYHKGVRSFLEKNPFIFLDQKTLKGLISVEQDHPLTVEEVQSLTKTYSIPGLDCLIILSDQGFSQQAEEFVNSNSIQKVQLKLMGEKEDYFSLWYLDSSLWNSVFDYADIVKCEGDFFLTPQGHSQCRYSRFQVIIFEDNIQNLILMLAKNELKLLCKFGL